MTWIVRTLSRSVGQKVVVAVAGLSLSGFLVAHLAGNLLFFKGREALNGYAELLTSSPILPLAELGLAALFLIHIVVALRVTVLNWQARPQRYQTKRWEGGKTLGSATMWITGSLVLGFLVVHLLGFRFTETESLYDLAVQRFSSVPYSIGYVVCMLVLGLHVSHGFQSAFRTLGLVHPKYMPVVQWVSYAFAVVVAAGFSSIPIYLLIVGPEA